MKWRSTWKPARTLAGKLQNLLFAIARAQDLPHELDGLISHITVNFPWGSLLETGTDKIYFNCLVRWQLEQPLMMDAGAPKKSFPAHGRNASRSDVIRAQ